ncbi:MAG: type transporter [Gemmatimonadetes bacterium]|nr:type transporter [Gemmatimonadota bacterium]
MVRDPKIELPPEVRHTLLGDLREIVRELRSSRDLIYQITRRDIKIRYTQAIFGFAWALLLPVSVVLAGLAVRVAFVHMSNNGVLPPNQVAGVSVKAVPWAFFVACLNTATPSLVSNISLVTKTYFPREVLPLSAVLAQSVDTLIATVLIALTLPFFHVTASLQLLWVPVLLAMLWVFTLAVALFLSCANIFFRDVKYLVQVFLTFGIFVTPVVLDASMYGKTGAMLMMLNPIAPVLEGLRLSIVQHHNLLEPMASPAGFIFWHPWYLAYTAVWAVLGLLFSAILFHRCERRFAELV